MLDHVGDGGDLLLEIALVPLQTLEPLLPVRERWVPAAEAVAAVSVSVHVHLLPSYVFSSSGRVDRSLPTDARAEPARPAGGVASDASYLSKNCAIVEFAPTRAPAQGSSKRRPSSVRSYVR